MIDGDGSGRVPNSEPTGSEKSTHVRAGAEDAFDILGIRNLWKVRGAETGGRYCVAETVVAPGAGVPPHQHVYQESFFPLEGSVEFAKIENGRTIWFRVAPGEALNVPSWAWHRFRNVGSEPARILMTGAAEVEQFFERAGVPVPASQPLASGPPSPEEIQRVIGLAIADGQRFAPLEAEVV